MVAVLDWELSTTGNSLVDIASALSQYYGLYPGIAQLSSNFEELGEPWFESWWKHIGGYSGIPKERELLDLYLRYREVESIPEGLMQYMEAFQCLRMAGILYGVLVGLMDAYEAVMMGIAISSPNTLHSFERIRCTTRSVFCGGVVRVGAHYLVDSLKGNIGR